MQAPSLTLLICAVLDPVFKEDYVSSLLIFFYVASRDYILCLMPAPLCDNISSTEFFILIHLTVNRLTFLSNFTSRRIWSLYISKSLKSDSILYV